MIAHIIFWLFLIPFSIINSSSNNFVVNGYCHGHQRSLLLQLKNNLIFNSEISSKLVHWKQSEHDCCQWDGVTCKDGHVTALDLSQESISGGLNDSSALFSLQYLQSLNLALNKFNSVIPQALHKLQNLSYLNLSDAGFDGYVPIEISHLTRLVTLDLSSTFISHQSLKLAKQNMAILVKNLTNIIELYLDGVAICTSGEEWGRALSSLEGLRVLSMSSCNLSGPIDSSLVKLQSLSLLKLSHNKLSCIVPNFFANFSNLTILQLSSCGLHGSFPKDIFQIHKLNVLDISDNQNLNGSLPDFPPLASLHYLNLTNTNFSGPLPNTISNLKQLSTIDLSYCQFNGTLPSSMSELTQLVYLDMSSNYLTGPLPSFNMSKNLTYLSLFLNHLSGDLPSSHFEGLQNLVSIDLGFNSFKGKMPSSLLKLPYLRELKLPFNQIGGLLVEFDIASSVLEMLDLGSNNLQGHIPVSVFNLRKLRVLQLSSNKLNGTIQLDIIRRLSNLTVLGLSNNFLSIDVNFRDDHQLSLFREIRVVQLASCNLRGIPSFLRNQSKLLFLDISRNDIEGSIPNWIWKHESLLNLNLSKNSLTNFEETSWNLSSNLYMVDLSFNRLQGPISFIPKHAFYLDYSSNKLSSIVQPDIGNYLPAINILFLSNNSFKGEIDESLCNASYLRLLDLSYNNFDGKIPKCFATLSSRLLMLNFEGNKLHGHIPDIISPNSCALRYLNLNDNLLNGSIPKSLVNCNKLQVLNLGNNFLSDRFPCFLSNISTLRIMVLRSNKLHGSIGCPTRTGDWKMLHIVDLASNNLNGRIPVSLLNSWKAMMRDEDVLGTELGHLFFDIDDNFHPMSFKAMLPALDKRVSTNLIPFLENMSRSIIDQEYAKLKILARYQVSINIVNKGHQMKLVKIQSALTYVDMSSNYLEGPIPNELMQFKALNALNLSHNALMGHIPSLVGNLKNLESMDISNNSLNGEIPQELSSLSFLAYMNLSFNHLVGRIPLGTQIQTFDVDSFEGNEGLCGPPLTKICELPQSASETPHSQNESFVEWSFISIELGFLFGFGVFILPVFCWKKLRLWYSKHVDEMLYRFIPRLDFVYEQHEGKRYKTLKWMY
ncbi:putative leucine-rich repeat-containing, plant-type, leucine-rich repeat domain, L [Medicago truncatula]|uniref:Putative leucine-rich repeat-containing, plant-type, leucine-rich repeat domain, L n=1 Tax=Medicago truncatula TaxID=3880 RepID=G7JQ66_MEDTR|nr:receptor-like protein 19 [Medicago truncatula]AES86942.1 verticillium wilt disease resistance protein [Medicago truncatula]RHN58878.1 putative leucine-rich repeat-containing, plant-type, leucine-rich repeat domain, L [Medicago truncatula]